MLTLRACNGLTIYSILTMTSSSTSSNFHPGYQVYGVNVGANDGEVWGAYSYTTSASSGSTIIPAFSFLVLLAIVAAAIAVVVVVLITRRKTARIEPAVVT